MWSFRGSRVKSVRAVVTAGVAAAGVAAVTVAAAPAGAATHPAVLAALACPSKSQCVAVGVNAPAMPTRLLGNQWNGSRWSQGTMPDPRGAVNVRESGVACPSATQCVAVGVAFPPHGGDVYPTASYWNGSRWTTGRAAGTRTSAELIAVSCPSTSSCVAVGAYGATEGTALPLIEHWDGRGWSRQAAPLPAGIRYGVLNDVSCSSPAMCVAVGNGQGHAIEARWNGRAWSAASLPNSRNVTLFGVSCHATTCLAAGADNDGTSPGTYQLAGATWSFRGAPAPRGAAYPALQSVSCPTASQCLAVGNYGRGGVFADRWNGRAWVGVPMHQSGGLVRYFEQVSCVAPDSCMALGSSSALGASWRSQAAYWDGSSWKVTPTA